MAQRPSIKWTPFVAQMLGTMVILCTIATPTRAAEDEARVLILNGTDPYLAAFLIVDGAMRASLANETARHITLFSETLDAQRFPIESMEQEFRALFAKKYAALRIDVVVTITRPALDFFLRHGNALWPGARLVFHSVPKGGVEATALPPNARGATTSEDIAGTLAIAQRLQPKSPRILVIAGVGEIDRRLELIARQVLATNAGAATVEFLSGWPQPELVARVSAEPSDSIVLYLAQYRDREGRPYAPRDVLRAIGSASTAPVYAIFETYVGVGATAASAESFEERGRMAGNLVRAALAGAPPDPGRSVLETASRCVTDARALQRWSLDARRLPDGCEIRFADRSYWREHISQIVAALTIIVAQTLLIVTLLTQRHRRRTAEAEALKRYSEMAHMNRRVALGELSASIAHELNQPLGAIHNNAGAAEMLIKANPPKLQEVAEILADIKRDDQRASDVIARIRKMLRKTEFEVREMDLNETIDETMKMLSAEASAKGVSLESDLDSGIGKVKGDRVEVQQVILNLGLNAMDAMHDQPADKRVLTIRSRRANSKEAEVSVVDSGVGIPGGSLSTIFDPFVTTKPGGMGLGLAISRTIVEAHGGQIRAEHRPAEGGAAVHFTLPFVSTARL